VTVSPATATIEVGQTISFTAPGSTASSCTWASSDQVKLASLGGAEFRGERQGAVEITATCGSATGIAWVVVAASAPSASIVITKGGTYSGIWSSTTSTPAITVNTDQSVVITNSIVTGKGNLIVINGTGAGSNVQISNVTAIGLDPQVANMQRPVFLIANDVATLEVQNCSLYGVSFGVKVASSTPSSLVISNNLASQLEDRASDGKGNLLANRPSLGHFILLNGISAPTGATISWNQVVQIVGESSTEDVINIYKSTGASGKPIWVHDNYIEGNSSTTTTTGYTGTGIITDGSAVGTQTAYVLIEANEVVHTANAGIEIANGHDISAIANRVVSCGKDSFGNWFAMPSANALNLYNAYGAAVFYNNTMTGNSGGLVRPASNGTPMKSDIWANAADMKDPGNSNSGNSFTDPCMSGTTLTLTPENTERAFWQSKLVSTGERIGNQDF
jgi:hypothetical protein